MKGCVGCGGDNAVISVSLMNRGGRDGLICRDCFKKMSGHGGKVIPAPAEDTKPALKDVVNSYSVMVDGNSLDVMAELLKKGCDVSKVAGNTPRVYFPEKNRLNSIIRYAESLKLMEKRHGVKFNGFRLVLSSESNGVSCVYDYNGSVDSWACFVRNAENDFCELIGCPQWSALKTGTRVKG